jgi:hypothetical protein
MNTRDLVKEHVLLEATDRVNGMFENGVLEREKNFDGKFNCKRALRENGWMWDDIGSYYFNQHSAATSFAEFERDLCEDQGFIPAENFSFPLEYHLVSPTLADELINRRETVLSPEGSDDRYWGRMATDRAIHLDPIIRSISELMDSVDLTYVDDAENTDLDAEEEVVEEVDVVEEVSTEVDSGAEDEGDDEEDDEALDPK